MARVAINGLGRIGRAALKLMLGEPQLELIAVNDLVPADNLAYLLKYDTVYGRYDKTVEARDNTLVIEGKEYEVLNEKDPANLPWAEKDIDIVLECTGLFTKKEDMMKHIRAGARRVLLSAPSKSTDVPTVVYGVNEAPEDSELLSCASCTTNCIAPLVEIMGRRIGIKKAIMTTVHAYTSSQALVDGPNRRFRRGRAAGANFVPTTTGAGKATTRVLPEYEGRFDGVAVRGPVPAGSLADVVFVTERPTSIEEVNRIFEEESQGRRYQGTLGVVHDPIVSSDIVHDPRGSIVDLTMTQVVDGDLVKVMSWYDNEWGYASQLVKEAVAVGRVPAPSAA